MSYNPDIHHRRSIRLKEYDYSRAGAYFVTICAQNRECLFGKIMDGRMLLNDNGEIVRDEWLKAAEMNSDIILDEFVIMPNHFHGIVIFTKSIVETIPVGAIPVGAIPVGAIHESPQQHAPLQRTPQHPSQHTPQQITGATPTEPAQANPAGGIPVGAIPVGAIHESPLQHTPLQHTPQPMTVTQRRNMGLPKFIGRFKMLSSKQINILRQTPQVPVWQRNYYEHIIRNEDDLYRIREYIKNNPARWEADENNPAVENRR